MKTKVLSRRVKKYRKKRTFNIVFVIFTIVLAFVLTYYFAVVCPVIIKLSEEKIKALATYSTSEVVGEVLTSQGTTYDDLVNITYSKENKIELIEVNSITINTFIREVTEKLQTKIDELSSQCISLEIGSFSGIPFLYGKGGKVSFKLVPVGVVNTELNSSFSTAGINQTLHRLNIVVTVTIGLVLPNKTQNFTTDFEVMICESIIIGQIPEIYLQ